ncbi:glycosyltransferase [Nocardia cyriacigeorgica]|uniref:Glycosyltransferase n=1 Tax=Nocardia cyriacigeorgica TaxID=135487 RepID=A0A5R8P7I8_9NOCA|nr:glycosyltransferase family 2 protein [Nocardia cyriacigeorgica]TLF99572.1 glycosyltransferase [Nocardia cyriacigeorgica]
MTGATRGLRHRPAGTGARARLEPNPLVAGAVRVGAGIAVAGCAVAIGNLATMRRLRPGPPVDETVAVCVPAREEAERLPRLIADLRAQTGVPGLRVLILDDGSADGTETAARHAAGDDPRVTVLRCDDEPEPGWTGKAAACARLAEAAAAAGATVLVFVDADVRLEPAAIAAAVTELRARRVALVSPWPRQLAHSPAEHLVQPLLCWSWATTLPVALADRGRRPSMVVACGQFLVFDAAAYRAIGGHAAVAGSVTEDLDIARALRRHGSRTAVVASGPMARTRMYRDAAELEAGYTRWLWSAYGGSVAGGLAVGAVAALAYWVPPLAAVAGRGQVRRAGLLGYAAAVAGRVVARCLDTGSAPRREDVAAALAHPLSVTAYLYLWARSHRARRHHALMWKGRALAS